ncbi:MAG: tetratricopeptide repeat protein [Chitinophagaceae bacterium]
MKSVLLFLSTLLLQQLAFPQGNGATSLNTTAGAHTYAVVVGISKYENTGIPQLDFAHKDALVFSNFLKSAAGGQVPEENIRLLLNEQATFAAIYDALDWLLHTCQQNDLVYFYFSGHGDMENSTIYKLGFLLSYNTPRNNYINNAVRIEDLNNIANTLSVKVNAKVVMITDACHSGKLAGNDYRGTYLAGDQLRAVQTKEIRITSCAPDQLSAEDEGWGGGRGVFSYYLVNGLEGLADVNHDKTVTVSEIKNYLDSSLAGDGLLAQKAMKQSPVIRGNSVFKLANVNEVSLMALKTSSATVVLGENRGPMAAGALKPLPAQPQTWFFNLLQKNPAEELIDFPALSKLEKNQISFAALGMLEAGVRKRVTNNAADSLQATQDLDRIGQLENTLRQNKDALNRFNNKLAVVLSDRGQQIINQFLEGDAAELERRRYYNSRNSGYDVYPPMFAVALKLTSPENYLYQLLLIKLHYFAGVAARIKIPTAENPVALIDTALAEQQQAFKLEENAAYINNELGLLYFLKQQPAAAEKYFLRATQIAPQWAIPWSNLAAIYNTKKENFGRSMVAIQHAIDLQPSLTSAYNNKGMLNEKQGRLLSAEELFRKSIVFNPRHYLPFERAAYVFLNTTQYAMADSFFYEAQQRKQGLHAPLFADTDMDGVANNLESYVLQPSCYADSTAVSKNDVLGLFVLAMQAYDKGNKQNAEKKFKEVIALDKTHPLAFHYLGVLLYQQHRWQEAEINFKFAINCFLDSAAFNAYSNTHAQKPKSDTAQDVCIAEKFRSYAYIRAADNYLAGRMYQQWHHYAEAEAQYRQVITLQPLAVGGYYRLWNMLEEIKRYDDAEDIIRNYSGLQIIAGLAALNSFYERMKLRYPGEMKYYYKAGLLLYSIAAADPSGKNSLEFGRATPAPSYNPDVEITGEISPAQGIRDPLSDAIDNLQMADSLLQGAGEELQANINYKIGDLYVWKGMNEKAASYYKKSTGIQPGNASTRIKLIDIYDSAGRYSEALAQLDSLYRRIEINLDKQVLMAKYYIHESRFAEANSLLKDAKQRYFFSVPRIADLNGRLLLLSGQPKKALAFYIDFLAANPGDAGTMYTIAGIHAKTGNSAAAWKWLERAMEQGFDYGWVLKFDPTWNKYRQQLKWTALQQRFPVRQYVKNIVE